jgi:ribonuclease E
MPDTPRHHHWRNLAELLGAELPPGSEPITPAKPAAEPSEERVEPATVPSSLAEAAEAPLPSESPAPVAATESAAPSAPQAPVTVSAAPAASRAPATPSKPPPRKSHWGLLARQLGLTPPEEPEEVVEEAAAEPEVVAPAAKPAAAEPEVVAPAAKPAAAEPEVVAPAAKPAATAPEKPGAAAASGKQTPARPGKPSEPRVASAWGRPTAQDEEPDEFSVVPSTDVLARDSSLVSDWHEHAGDITTDAPEELDLEEHPVPTRRRRSALDEVSHESTVEEDQGTGEEEEGDEPRRRRRRRRRRRSGRGDPTALGASELDESSDVEFMEDDTEDILLDEFAVEEVEGEGELEEAPRADTRRRRGSRRRSRRGAGERDRDRTGPERESRSVYPTEFESDRLTDRDAELDDEDEVEGDELDEESRPKHTKIPTWDQAIGVLIDANLASRARSPHGNSRARGRGRGPRR